MWFVTQNSLFIMSQLWNTLHRQKQILRTPLACFMRSNQKRAYRLVHNRWLIFEVKFAWTWSFKTLCKFFHKYVHCEKTIKLISSVGKAGIRNDAVAHVIECNIYFPRTSACSITSVLMHFTLPAVYRIIFFQRC